MVNIDKSLLSNIVDISRSYGFDISIDTIIDRYSEPHRYWHTLNHLYVLVNGIKSLFEEKKIDKREYDILIIAAIFHDIVYDTKSKDNEEKSVEFMMSTFNQEMNEDIKKISDIILGTKTHDSKERLLKEFNELDTSILDASFIDMLDWENKIYKEFKWVGWSNYKKRRIEVLLELMKEHPDNSTNIKNLISFINNKIPKIGICYYEIDKLPSIENYIENNKKINKIFDSTIVIIVYNFNDEDVIKKYSSCLDKDQEFFTLSENSIPNWYKNHISKQGHVTIVKEHKYMKNYNEEINNFFIENDVRVIYI